MDAVQPGAGRGRLATAVGWLTLGLACVALAVVEHERARAAATGRSVLCGSVLACSDGLEGEALAARRLVVAGKRKLPARPHRLQGLQAGEDDTGDGSAPPVGLEAAIDGFDLRTFGGEAPDVYEDMKYFGRYQEPGDNGIEQPVHPAPNVLDSYIGEDSYKPFYEHSRLLQPGDVPGDEPTPHHKRGLYNLFGALADTNENLLTGEMEAQACCKCIPGAPDYREKKDYMGVINPLTGVVPAVGAFLQDAETDAEDLAGDIEADAVYAAGVLQEDAGYLVQKLEEDVGALGNGAASGAAGIGHAVAKIPPAVAGAMHIGGGGGGGAAEQASGNSTAPAEGGKVMDGDLPVVEAFPLVDAIPTDGTEGAPPAEEAAPARRLLEVQKAGLSKGRTQALDGYMLVHVPESAGPGEIFKAKSPSGHIWAFKVPEELPENRIIKLHLPDLKGKASASLKAFMGVSQRQQKLDEEAPAEEASAGEAPAEDEAPVEVEVSADGNSTEDGNATDGINATGEAPVEDSIYGFGPGKIPLAANAMEPCCMCPLYDEDTGEIEGWIANVPADVNGAGKKYIEVAEAVAAREEHLDDVMGQKVFDPSWLNAKLQWDGAAEGEGANGTNASADTNATESGDAGEESAEGGEEAAEGGEEAEPTPEAEATVAEVANHHQVQHLHQKPPVHSAVTPPAKPVAAVDKGPKAPARPRVGTESPLQAQAKAVARSVAKKPTAIKTAAIKSEPKKLADPVVQPEMAKGKPVTKPLPAAATRAPVQAIAEPLVAPAAPMATAQPLPASAQAPVQAVAVPLPERAVADQPLPKAVEAIAQPPIMQASNRASDVKAEHVTAKRTGPDSSDDAGRMAPETVQAVAVPMTAAVAAQKPVQVVAEPVQN